MTLLKNKDVLLCFVQSKRGNQLRPQGKQGGTVVGKTSLVERNLDQIQTPEGHQNGNKCVCSLNTNCTFHRTGVHQGVLCTAHR